MDIVEFVARRTSPFVWDPNSKQVASDPLGVKRQKARALRRASIAIQAVRDFERQQAEAMAAHSD